MLYPLNLTLKGKTCVIIGGGQVAERKAKTLLEAEALIIVIAPKVTREIASLAAKHKLKVKKTGYQCGMIKSLRPLLVFCAASDDRVNISAIEEAKSCGALVNAATRPDLTDFQVPAKVISGDLLFTVSTNGKSPALAKLIRQQLAVEYPPAFADFLERMSRLRQAIKMKSGGSKAHQDFWRQALKPSVIDLVRAGRLDQAEYEVRNGIIDAGVES